jgi:hypothetical protein
MGAFGETCWGDRETSKENARTLITLVSTPLIEQRSSHYAPSKRIASELIMSTGIAVSERIQNLGFEVHLERPQRLIHERLAK